MMVVVEDASPIFSLQWCPQVPVAVSACAKEIVNRMKQATMEPCNHATIRLEITKASDYCEPSSCVFKLQGCGSTMGRNGMNIGFESGKWGSE